MEDCELALQLMRQDAARGAFNATKCAGPVCFFHVGRWKMGWESSVFLLGNWGYEIRSPFCLKVCCCITEVIHDLTTYHQVYIVEGS